VGVHLIDGHVRVRAVQDGRKLVDATQPSIHARELLLRDEIRLVEQQSVCKGDLRDRLVHDARGHLCVEVLLDVLGVHQSDDAIDPRERLDRVVDQEGLRNRRGIGHPSGLDDDGVEVQLAGLAPARELLKDRNQVAPHRAADATVEHLDELFGVEPAVLRDEGVVDGDITELVLDDCYLLAVRGRQDVVEQRCLATSEEAGEHSGGNTVCLLVLVLVLVLVLGRRHLGASEAHCLAAPRGEAKADTISNLFAAP